MRICVFDKYIDTFFSQIQYMKTYLISGGRLKPVDERFRGPSNNETQRTELEIHLQSKARIIESDEGPSISIPQYEFTSITNMFDIAQNDFLNIVGVISYVSPTEERLYQGKYYYNKEIRIVDEACIELSLELEGNKARSLTFHRGMVLAVIQSTFQGYPKKVLRISGNTLLLIDPETPEKERLRRWFDELDISITFSSFTHLPVENGAVEVTISEILSKQHRRGIEYYYILHARILRIFYDPCIYMSCRKATCLKKVVEREGFYDCDKCKESSTEKMDKFILKMDLGDYDDTPFITGTCFHEAVCRLLHQNDTKFISSLKENDRKRFDTIFTELEFKLCRIHLRANIDTCQKNNTLKYFIEDIRVDIEHFQLHGEDYVLLQEHNKEMEMEELQKLEEMKSFPEPSSP